MQISTHLGAERVNPCKSTLQINGEQVTMEIDRGAFVYPKELKNLYFPLLKTEICCILRPLIQSLLLDTSQCTRSMKADTHLVMALHYSRKVVWSSWIGLASKLFPVKSVCRLLKCFIPSNCSQIFQPELCTMTHMKAWSSEESWPLWVLYPSKTVALGFVWIIKWHLFADWPTIWSLDWRRDAQ